MRRDGRLPLYNTHNTHFFAPSRRQCALSGTFVFLCISFQTPCFEKKTRTVKTNKCKGSRAPCVSLHIARVFRVRAVACNCAARAANGARSTSHPPTRRASRHALGARGRGTPRSWWRAAGARFGPITSAARGASSSSRENAGASTAPGPPRYANARCAACVRRHGNWRWSCAPRAICASRTPSRPCTATWSGGNATAAVWRRTPSCDVLIRGAAHSSTRRVDVPRVSAPRARDAARPWAAQPLTRATKTSCGLWRPSHAIAVRACAAACRRSRRKDVR